jgi:dihydrofolate synthase/folylpolyglutamate synthase
LSPVEATLERLAARRPRIIDLSLARVHAALARLGDPHRRLPPVIHVAGTNGKGSTVAYLRAMIEAAGGTAHVYTSPHLVRFNERIILAGQEIDDGRLIDAVERCDRAVGEEKLTYFEITTCAAFLAFAETQADYLVLEVGLGGRLDATNVLEKPLAAAVAPIGYDHEKFLGDKLSLIAAEKAGIFRRGVPAVIGRQGPEAAAALKACAGERGAPVFAFGEHWDSYSENGRLIYKDRKGLKDLSPPRLFGAHQYDNAGLAVAAAEAGGLNLPDDAISEGLVRAFTPARLQRLTKGPIVDLARRNDATAPEIWLDGGHNPSAGRAVAAAMAQLEERSRKPLVMISGLQSSKNAVGYFEPFADLARNVCAVAAHCDGAAKPEDTAVAARKAGLAAEPFASVEDAFRRCLAQNVDEPIRVLISGSLYLAGEILRENG